jgi:uncharacterized protein YjbI with pentapeptide repeats
MAASLIKDQVFDGHDFTQGMPEAEYEQCQFINCRLDGANLSSTVFTECTFSNCSLSNAQLHQTALRQVKFAHCKMLGLAFDTINPFLFQAGFDDCDLSYSIFAGTRLKIFRFNNCVLHQVDFTGADLSKASFYESDLAGALFLNTNLEEVDFSNAYNFIIDPEKNKMKKAKFHALALEGLLHKYQIQLVR